MQYNLRYIDYSINVHCKEQELLTFLETYFLPYFSIDSLLDELAIANIHITIDPDYIVNESIHESFIIDSSKGFLSARGINIKNRSNNIKEILVLPMQALVSFNKDKKEIHVKAASTDRVKIPVLRIIEDLIQIEVELGNGVFIHASGTAFGDSAVLAIGDKQAGKTSFLCNSLHNFNCHKLTNDNAVLFIQDNKVIVRGWPSFLKIEIGTVAHNQILAEFYPKQQLSLFEEPQSLWNNNADKISFYPEQGAALFQSTIKAQAEMSCLIFPEFSVTKIGCTKVNMNDVEIESILKLNLQGTFNKKHPNWHLFNKVEEDTIYMSLKKIAELLSKQVETFKITWGPSLNQLLTEIDLMSQGYKPFVIASSNNDVKNSDYPPMPLIYN